MSAFFVFTTSSVSVALHLRIGGGGGGGGAGGWLFFSWVSARVLCFPETLKLLLVLEVFKCWVGGGFSLEVLVGLGGRFNFSGSFEAFWGIWVHDCMSSSSCIYGTVDVWVGDDAMWWISFLVGCNFHLRGFSHRLGRSLCCCGGLISPDFGFRCFRSCENNKNPGDSNLHLQEGQVQLLAVAIWGNLVGYESRSLMLYVFVPFLGREDVFGALLRNPSLRYLKILTSLSALSNMWTAPIEVTEIHVTLLKSFKVFKACCFSVFVGFLFRNARFRLYNKKVSKLVASFFLSWLLSFCTPEEAICYEHRNWEIHTAQKKDSCIKFSVSVNTFMCVCGGPIDWWAFAYCLPFICIDLGRRTWFVGFFHLLCEPKTLPGKRGSKMCALFWSRNALVHC